MKIPIVRVVPNTVQMKFSARFKPSPFTFVVARMRRSLDNLQALRGIACLLVVFYHLGIWENMVWPRVQLTHPFRWFGYAGVDLFFAISGFIIVYSHLDHLGNRAKLPGYLFRRAWRIFPVFWVAMFATAVLLYTVANQPQLPSGWPHDWFEWLLLMPRNDGNRVLPVAWSLTYEVMFYLTFSLLLLLPKRFAWCLGVIWAAIVLTAKVLVYEPASAYGKMPFSPYVLEFLGGALAAVLVKRGYVRGPRTCLFVGIAWAASVVALLAESTADAFSAQTWYRVLAFGPASVLIVYAMAAGEQKRWRYLRIVGDASYSIYLYHSVFFVCALFASFGISHRFWPHLVWLGILFGSGVGGGLLMYYLVERPLTNAIKRRPRPEPSIVMAQRIPCNGPPLAASASTRLETHASSTSGGAM